MEVFLESIELFVGQNEQTNTCMRKTFINFSSQNMGFRKTSKKHTKVQFEYNGDTTYLTKGKSRTLLLFTKNTQMYILSIVLHRRDNIENKIFYSELINISVIPGESQQTKELRV